MSKSSRKRARRRERNKPVPTEYELEQKRRSEEEWEEHHRKVARPLVEFLEKKVARCDALDAKRRTPEKLSVNEKAELDMLQRMEVERFAILFPKRFKNEATAGERRELHKITGLHYATLERLAEKKRAGTHMTVYEHDELDFSDRIARLTRRADIRIGNDYIIDRVHRRWPTEGL